MTSSELIVAIVYPFNGSHRSVPRIHEDRYIVLSFSFSKISTSEFRQSSSMATLSIQASSLFNVQGLVAVITGGGSGGFIISSLRRALVFGRVRAHNLQRISHNYLSVEAFKSLYYDALC